MDALGINFVNIIIYIVLFAILYIILNKYFLKNLIKNLEKRQNEIREGFELKESMSKEWDNMNIEKEQLLDMTKEEGRKKYEEIIGKAKEQGKEIIEKAEKEASLIVEKANAKLDEERATIAANTNKEVEAKVKQVLDQVYSKYKVQIDEATVSEAIKNL